MAFLARGPRFKGNRGGMIKCWGSSFGMRFLWISLMEPLSVLLQIFNDLLDAVGHLAPRSVPIGPEGYGLAVFR
jgi:hypothetical protein